MIKKLTRNINSFLIALESKAGLLSASLLLGVMMLLLAMIYVQPSFDVDVKYHGSYFSELSEHPFRFSENNPLQYRILAPFIGYITFLRGDLFFILPLLFDVFLLAAVYYHYRKINYEVTDAFIMTAFICFSGTILIPLIAPAYIDSITYFFLFLAFAKAARIKSSAFFFFLSMRCLNCGGKRKTNLHMLSCSLLYSRQHNYSSRSIVHVFFALLFRQYFYRQST